MKPTSTISIRAAACGIFACSLFTFLSGKIESQEIMASLRHQEFPPREGWVQAAVLLASIVFTYVLCRNSLRQLYLQRGAKGLLTGIVLTLGLFVLGFGVVGICLPSRV